jgi:hypothetical protein
MLGYSHIPAFWLEPLQEIEPMTFEGTSMSLQKVYDISLRHALEMITKPEEKRMEIRSLSLSKRSLR